MLCCLNPCPLAGWKGWGREISVVISEPSKHPKHSSVWVAVSSYYSELFSSWNPQWPDFFKLGFIPQDFYWTPCGEWPCVGGSHFKQSCSWLPPSLLSWLYCSVATTSYCSLPAGSGESVCHPGRSPGTHFRDLETKLGNRSASALLLAHLTNVVSQSQPCKKISKSSFPSEA